MDGDDFDLGSFMTGYGFTEDELNGIEYELDSLRSIPGTTLRRYLNRVVATVGDGERAAFLKGVYLGVAVRSAAYAANAEDATSGDIDIIEEEHRIAEELKRLGRPSRR